MLLANPTQRRKSPCRWERLLDGPTPTSTLARLPRSLLLDPSPVPLYHRLVQAIRQLIDGGAFQTEEQLPAEQAVADYFHISRPTVRQAWQELEHRRYIVRDHGRGTFIRVAISTNTQSTGVSSSRARELIGR